MTQVPHLNPLSPNNGSSAFPTTQYANGISPTGHDSGMTLRDYFAAKAMQGLIAATVSADSELNEEDAALVSYRMADAMLKEERRRRNL